MRPCIECGVPTEGSIGAAGLKWTMLCQPCKDQADRELATSIAAMTAAIDYALPRTLEVLRGGQAALLDPQPAQPLPSTPEAA